jgi:F-box protein 21
MVYAPQGLTLDGKLLAGDETVPEVMYLDPFHTDSEIPVEHLKARLTTMGTSDVYLKDSSPREMVIRTARNIFSTIQEFEQGARNHNRHPIVKLHRNPFADVENALYAALWSYFMLGLTGNATHHAGVQQLAMDANAHLVEVQRLRRYLPFILDKFQLHFPADASLIQRHIIPTFQESPESSELLNTERIVRAGDSMPKQIHARNTESLRQSVKFQVGQVFKHKRYNYVAVITGWDVRCEADELWMRRMGVDTLSRGRNQSFYHVL